MTCYKIMWTNTNGTTWFNLLDTMQQALDFAASQPLDEVSKIVKPGISTDDIDKVCYEFINDHKAYSAPLFYRGFPKSCCT